MYMVQSKNTPKGFSLVELLVVVAIITIIATIILASIMQARQNTREKKRLSDLANIEFALTLYKEKNRNYPIFPTGIELGIGNVMDDAIRQYSGNTYADPLAEGGDGIYEYWFDSSFTCSEPGQIVIYIRTMEQSKNANFNTLCTHASRDIVISGPNTYIEILKQ